MIFREIDLEMITVPLGDISMRDDRTGAAWKVSIEPFALCRYPVTQAQ